MRCLVIISIFICITLITACGNMYDYVKSDMNAFNKAKPSDAIIAWNEDTINNYQVTLLNKGRFVYAIKNPDINHQSIIKYYGGDFYVIGDSIALRFRDDISPPGMAKYMIEEASGNYLIQYFTDGSKRMFLRINKPRLF